MRRLLILLLLAILIGCQSNDNLVEVRNVKVVDIENKGCVGISHCYKVIFQKGETELKMVTPNSLARAIEVGTELNIKYNPESLKVIEYSFDDFSSGKGEK